MAQFALFCKSYKPDMLRARRLAQSINRYNRDNIPFYISVPAIERKEFEECFRSYSCTIISDEDILDRSGQVSGKLPSAFPGHLLQQLVKLEFWRMGLCANYLWLDADSYFVRDFGVRDFFSEEQMLYTVIHDSKEIRDYALRHNKQKIVSDFERSSRINQAMFARQGECYDFGPSPALWSCKVLEGLWQDYCLPKGLSILEVLQKSQSELLLYGEYLLFSKAIPLKPIGPLFKCFHYPEQFFEAQTRGEWDHAYAQQGYLGVVIQSNWARVAEKKTGLWREMKTLLRRQGIEKN